MEEYENPTTPKDAFEILAELYKSYVDIRADLTKTSTIMRSDDFTLDHLDDALTKIGSRLFQTHQHAHALHTDDLKAMYNAQTAIDKMASRDETTTDKYQAAVHSVQSASLTTKDSFREAHEVEIQLLEFEQACTSLPDYMRHVSEEILAELYTLYPLHEKRDPKLFESEKTGYGTGLLID